MSEFTDVSGEYGDGPRCVVCHCGVHDEESGPLCDNMKLEAKVDELLEAAKYLVDGGDVSLAKIKAKEAIAKAETE